MIENTAVFDESSFLDPADAPKFNASGRPIYYLALDPEDLMADPKSAFKIVWWEPALDKFGNGYPSKLPKGSWISDQEFAINPAVLVNIDKLYDLVLDYARSKSKM